MIDYEYECPVCGETAEAEIPDAQLKCRACGHEMDRVYFGTLHLWDGGYPSKQAAKT